MRIEKLTLFGKNLKAQEEFYGALLGFPILSSEANELAIETGETMLVFQQNLKSPIYHFAFLIPTGSLEAAIDFAESKGIELLPLNDEKIIHFDSGRSIYFYDSDGNIAEFIERPKLSYSPKQTFEISDVIRINEIGHPVIDPIKSSHELMDKFGIRPINPSAFRDNFCWVGDHEGAMIVVSEGRHWLPTQVPSVINDFEMTYEEGEIKYQLKCQAGEVTRI